MVCPGTERSSIEHMPISEGSGGDAVVDGRVRDEAGELFTFLSIPRVEWKALPTGRRIGADRRGAIRRQPCFASVSTLRRTSRARSSVSELLAEPAGPTVGAFLEGVAETPLDSSATSERTDDPTTDVSIPGRPPPFSFAGTDRPRSVVATLGDKRSENH
jgi:hypothetical protein